MKSPALKSAGHLFSLQDLGGTCREMVSPPFVGVSRGGNYRRPSLCGGLTKEGEEAVLVDFEEAFVAEELA